MKKNNFKIIELKPTKHKSSIKRTVFIKDFIIDEIIGLHKYEKIKKQKIKFNIVMDINQNSFPNEKDIKSIIDYEKVTNTNCTSCMMCVEGCPTSAIAYKWENPFSEEIKIIREKNYGLSKIIFCKIYSVGK